MVVLVLRDESGAAFICGIEGWLQSPEEKQQWQHLVTRLVQYAFESRPVTLITVAPMQWSMGHSLPEPHQLRTNQGQFLVNHVEQCSNELLAEIAESEEFQRGLLWLSAVDATDEHQLLSIVMELDVLSPAPSTSNTEVLLLLNDARRIHWLHPGRDMNTLEAEVLTITRHFGWRLSKESRTPS
jgi:hypothetical protein